MADRGARASPLIVSRNAQNEGFCPSPPMTSAQPACLVVLMTDWESPGRPRIAYQRGARTSSFDVVRVLRGQPVPFHERLA